MGEVKSRLVVTSHVNACQSAIDGAIKRALETCGGKAESYAKKLCPVDTGNLRDHITHQYEKDYVEVIGSPTEYAPYVEFGHHQEVGRYVAAIGKRLVRDYIPGKPYLTPAIEDHAKEYCEIIRAELNKL